MMSLKNKKGFTLIEIVIVLAIAALIILVVLQTVNAAQRSQRDNARKNVAAQMVSAITEFQSNHNGAVPAANALFNSSTATPPGIASYNPSFSGYTTVRSCGAQTSATKDVVYTVSGTTYTLTVCLESGDTDQVH